MQKISASLNLFNVQRDDEVHVLDRVLLVCLCLRGIAHPGIVEVLPRREGSTHGRSDQQVRLLLAEDLSRFLAFGPDIEVPWLTVVGIVDGDVEREARCEELTLGLEDLSSNSWWRVDFRNNSFRVEVANTSEKLLREDIVITRL